MLLKQTFKKPVQGYWDGGTKSSVTWDIVHRNGVDIKGKFAKIGSWSASHWFHVALGRTDKITLCNAMKHLRATPVGRSSTFEYIEEVS